MSSGNPRGSSNDTVEDETTTIIPSTTSPQLPIPSSNNRTYNIIRTALTIGFWYLISNAIILTTKWLFSNHFPYPLTVTTYSNGVAFLWAAIVRYGCQSSSQRQPLTRTLFWRYVLPIGLTTALEIGSSNLALKILTVSFGTILKGGGPIFTFLWGLVFGLERFSFQIGTSLILIAVGIALASLGEGQEFQFLGFCLQLFASSLGGLRWAMTHKLLKDGASAAAAEAVNLDGEHGDDAAILNNSSSNSDHHDHGSDDDDIDDNDHNHDDDEEPLRPMSPLTATFFTSPMTSLCVLPFALGLEGQKVWNAEHTGQYMPPPIGLESGSNTTQQLLDAATNSTQLDSFLGTNGGDTSETTIILMTMTLIATLVFILLMSEYWLVKATSSLALSVAGVLKELITIGGGIFFFAEHIDALNVVGFVMCQLGIMAYVCLRTTGIPSTEEAGGDYAPITVEEAAREAMEAQREMLSMDFPSERFADEEEGSLRHRHHHTQFSIDDDDL